MLAQGPPAPYPIRPPATADRPWRPLSAGRIPSLDGLRAVSILMVIGLHAINAHAQGLTGADYVGPWQMLLDGDLGVSIFFVISGFLITHLLLREQDRTGTIDLKAFYVRRSFRIWPAYYLFLAVVAGLQVCHVFWVGIHGLLSAATFTFNYCPTCFSWWLGHTKTLCVEEQFYLAWPVAVLLLSRRSAGRLAVGLILAVPVVRLVELRTLPPESFVVREMWRMVHTRLDTLMFGCAAALFYDGPRFRRVVDGCDRYGVTAAAVAYLIAQPVLQRLCPWPALVQTVGYTVEGACAVLVIVWAVRHADRHVGRSLNWRPLAHLGHISFSLYLWQQLFFVVLNHSWTGRYPANLFLAVGLAEASYWFVEQPVLRWRAAAMKPRSTHNRQVASPARRAA